MALSGSPVFTDVLNQTLDDGRIIKLPREKPQELIDMENRVKGMLEIPTLYMNTPIDEEVFDLMKSEDIDTLQKDYDKMSREIAEMEKSLN